MERSDAGRFVPPYREGGWSAEAIAETWATSVGRQLETDGDEIKLPVSPQDGSS